jgi:hypothetical protein
MFDKNDPFHAAKAKAVKTSGLSSHLHILLEDCGLRQGRVESEKYRRREVMVAHGFRKWFSTQLEHATKNPVLVEMLLGHNIGLKGSYYKPSLEDLYNGYMKGVDALTIDESNRLQHKNEELQKEVTEIQRLKADMARRDAELARIGNMLDDIQAMYRSKK